MAAIKMQDCGNVHKNQYQQLWNKRNLVSLALFSTYHLGSTTKIKFAWSQSPKISFQSYPEDQ